MPFSNDRDEDEEEEEDEPSSCSFSLDLPSFSELEGASFKGSFACQRIGIVSLINPLTYPVATMFSK
jgi:hypothetical protein